MTAIIILNWNGADDTISCLNSFSSVTGNFFIVVTDNGSNDDSTDRIKKYIDKSPLKIYLQELKSNYGFAKGNNMAISFALKFCPDNFLLLNNDTEVTPSFLKNLIDFSTNNSNYRVLTPQIRLYNSKDKIWNCGGSIIFGMRCYYFANKKIDSIPKTKKFLNISFITGCALFFYSDVLSNDGKLFTERFFFGEEDFEFSLRMKRKKIDMACVFNSVIYHKVGSAASKMDYFGKLYLHYLNRFINIRLNSNGFKFKFWRLVNMPFVLKHFYYNTKSISKTLSLWKKLKEDSIKKDRVSKDDFKSLVINKDYF
ncbi:MAG TPA: glycosyltransferase [Bacteroidaceae bacterium]|nr:glycosyltransferase [Bacteroidaceae bacterium]